MVTLAHSLPATTTGPPGFGTTETLMLCAAVTLVCALACGPVTIFLHRYAAHLPSPLVRRPSWLNPLRVGTLVILSGALTSLAAARWHLSAATTSSPPQALPLQVSPLLLGALVTSEGLVAALLAAAACCDLACRCLPNRLLLPAGLLAAAHTLAASWYLGTALYPWWLAALAGGVLYGLAGTGGIGLGDVKLVVVTLTWLVPLGWEGDANGLLWALVAAGAVAGVGRLSGRLSRGQTLALGPYLVAGALAARLAAGF